MADKKPRKPSFTSPKGVFRFPAITKPDYGNDEFPKPDGVYQVQLVLGTKEANELIAKLQPAFDQAIEEGKEKFSKLKVEVRKKLKDVTINDFYTQEYDKDTEEPTGNFIFKFSTAASGKNQKGEAWSRKVPVFDAKGKPLAKVPNIWGGTVGKVSFEVAPYFVAASGAAGLKCYLTAVQVIELVSTGGKSADGYGFGQEEGFDGSSMSDEGDAPFDTDADQPDTPPDDGTQDF